jgi:Uma2 family endonuclease
MSALPKHYWTVEEYLAFERASDQRHEYYDGEIFDMVGGTARHSLIIGNVNRILGIELDKTPCLVFTSDMRVRISKSVYTYPDVSAVCDAPRFEDDQQDTLVNPVLLVEVLSPSTEKYDREGKFEHYRQLSSLKDYVLITQSYPRIELYARQSDDSWLWRQVTDPVGGLELPSVGCTLRLSEVYKKIAFEHR